MRNVHCLPIRKDARGHYVLRLEAEKSDGTAIYAEGTLQRKAPVGLAHELSDFHVQHMPPDELLHLAWSNVSLLLGTLQGVAGEP